MLKRALVLGVIASGFATSLAHAQLPNLGNFLHKSNGGSIVAQQDGLVRSYVSANKDVLVANAKMADAVGLKDAAATAQATATALSDGATKGNLSDADKVQSETSQEVAAKLKDNPQLDAQAKATYTSGLSHLGVGLLKYASMSKNVMEFKNAAASASPMDIPKLQPAFYVVSTVPTNVSNLSNALNNAIAFAKSHDIPVPDDATKALSAI
jgi:hypothetical protein